MKKLFSILLLAFSLVGVTTAAVEEKPSVIVVTTDSADPAVNRQIELWVQIHLAEFLKTAKAERVTITYLKTGEGAAKPTTSEIQSPAFEDQTSKTMDVAAQALREALIVRDAFPQ